MRTLCLDLHLRLTGELIQRRVSNVPQSLILICIIVLIISIIIYNNNNLIIIYNNNIHNHNSDAFAPVHRGLEVFVGVVHVLHGE